MRTTLLFLALLLLPATVSAAPRREAPWKPGSVLHRTSKKHGHPYSLYVPSSYSPRVSWPVVISSHGRGGTGKGEIGQWTGLAREFGFIVACPDMCTATVNRPPVSKLPPAVEDEEVILSILDEIGEHFRTNPRAVMITGFSGGGNPSYWTGLRHPDRFTHICTRGGNFAPQEIPRDPKVLEAGRKRLSIYIYYGDHDHPLILGTSGKPGQARLAYEALRKAGYEHVKIEKIPGMKHQSRPRLAAEWFAAYLKANRKRFLAGDQADALFRKIEAELGKHRVSTAVRDLRKLEKLEAKAGLAPRAKAKLADLNREAIAKIGEARKARAAGDDKEALKILARVARDYRGLPAAGEAKDLAKEWKE